MNFVRILFRSVALKVLEEPPINLFASAKTSAIVKSKNGATATFKSLTLVAEAPNDVKALSISAFIVAATNCPAKTFE